VLYVDNHQTCAALIIAGSTNGDGPYIYLIIGNADTLTVKGDLTQTGAASDIYFQGGSLCYLQLYANYIQNSGVFNPTNSVVELWGSDTIKGVTTFNNLSCLSTDDKEMYANTTVLGSLDMSSGSLDMNGDTLTVNTVVNPNGYVVGAVEYSFAAASTFLYPVGSINGNTGPGYVTVHVTSGTYPAKFVVQTYGDVTPAPGDYNHCVSHCWQFGVLSGSIIATLTFDYSKIEFSTSDEPSYVIGRWNGHTYVAQSSHEDTVNHTIHVDGVTNPSSTYMIGIPAALPIVLSSFVASTHAADGVTLNWSTTSETNTYGFYVQRRAENTTVYATVSGLIPGAGTTLTKHNYSFTDAAVSNGTFYYRLKQVDLDGAVNYSNEIKLVVTGVLGVKEENAPRVFSLGQNYPNPFNPTTTIWFSVAKTEHATVGVYNTLGQFVRELFAGAAEAGKYYSVSFDASALPSGEYFYRLVTPTRNEAKRMVLIK